jgi:hypothetical protein
MVPACPLWAVRDVLAHLTAITAGEPVLTLSTSEFEMFRWRMGRRSLGQLAAMDWSGDPSAVLGKLTVFGPTASDIVE